MAEGEPLSGLEQIAVEPVEADLGLVDLLGQLATDARDVARAEAGMVKARALDTIDRYKAAAMLFAVAGTLGLAVLVALMVGLILTLMPYVGPGPATLIVVSVFGAVTAVLGLIGKARLSSAKSR